MFIPLYEEMSVEVQPILIIVQATQKRNEISFEKTEEKADRQTNGDTGWMNL